MNDMLTNSIRTKNPLVAEGVVRAVESIINEGREATFNEILEKLRAKGILSNHRSLRTYLDFLTNSGKLYVRRDRKRRPNIRPKQVYSPTAKPLSIEVGEKALVHYGLNWTLPNMRSFKAETDLEGLVRAQLKGRTLYGSLEDTILENFSRARKGAAADQLLSFCAALLGTKKIDRRYLQQRSMERGVGDAMSELLDEIDSVMTSPRPKVDDLKTLYAIRRWHDQGYRASPSHPPNPRWCLLSQDELVDALGKQLGMK